MSEINNQNISRKYFIASLAANFFFLGVLAHPILMHPPMPPVPAGMMAPFDPAFGPMAHGVMPPPMGMGPDPLQMLRHAAEDLSPAGQVALKHILESQKNAMPSIHERLMASFKDLHDLMQQDKIDPESLQKITTEIGQIQNEMHQTMQDTVLRISQDLSAEDRKKLAHHIGP